MMNTVQILLLHPCLRITDVIPRQAVSDNILYTIYKYTNFVKFGINCEKKKSNDGYQDRHVGDFDKDTGFPFVSCLPTLHSKLF